MSSCRYIIQLKSGNGVNDINTLCNQLEAAGTSCTYKYTTALLGFAAAVCLSIVLFYIILPDIAVLLFGLIVTMNLCDLKCFMML